MAKYKIYFTFSVDIDYPEEIGNIGQDIDDKVTVEKYAEIASKGIDPLFDRLHVTGIERVK